MYFGAMNEGRNIYRRLHHNTKCNIIIITHHTIHIIQYLASLFIYFFIIHVQRNLYTVGRERM